MPPLSPAWSNLASAGPPQPAPQPLRGSARRAEGTRIATGRAPTGRLSASRVQELRSTAGPAGGAEPQRHGLDWSPAFQAPIADSAKGIGHTQGGAIVASVNANTGATELLDHPGIRRQVRGR